jgi:hypothetical protein
MISPPLVILVCALSLLGEREGPSGGVPGKLVRSRAFDRERGRVRADGLIRFAQRPAG